MSHPRNRHIGRYDLKKLVRVLPELERFIVSTVTGESTIDFTNPEAVQMLNRALLKSYYGVEGWQVPPGYLCPPVPGRSDYIHLIADLLGADHDGEIPRGSDVRILDIGVGANCIYPIIGHFEYGWSFIGSDSDPVALESARKIAEANPTLKASLELRIQSKKQNVLKGVLTESDDLHAIVCNPPFHSSLEEAREGTRRKWSNLRRAPQNIEPQSKSSPVLNFGGQNSELWYPGGETAFILRLIRESKSWAKNVRWFSSLVSKEIHLDTFYRELKKLKPLEIRTLTMEQGQKKSRILAWTFQNLKLRSSIGL